MKFLRFVLVVVLASVFSLAGNAQKLPGLDKSPLDIAYFRPVKNEAPVIKVIYGRPQKNGRTMLGGTEAYGKVWRTGANEATEIKLYKDVTFVGKKISAGTYSLYTIPGATEWTIIFNTALDSWGAYSYDEKKDVARIKVNATTSADDVEAFTIVFDGKDGAGNMILAWEKTLVKVPFTY